MINYDIDHFILNLFRVSPSDFKVKVAILKSGDRPTLLTHIINMYAKRFIATPLTRDYNDIKSGIYVTMLGKDDFNSNDIRHMLRNSVEAYREKMKARERLPELEIDKKDFVTIDRIPARSYVVARLLNNAVRKIAEHKGLLSPRPGEENNICLDYERLESDFWKSGFDIERDRSFSIFCEEHDELCRGSGACGSFFKVVKCLSPRFQHIVKEDGIEEIYLILHSYYRRLSNLSLIDILEYVKSQNLDPSVLKDVKVNYFDGKDTHVCDVVDVSGHILKLKCEGKENDIDINSLSLPNSGLKLSINPNYSSSRRFIARYLCEEFEAHKGLNKRYPIDYFEALKNDIKIFKRIVGDICFSGTCFDINEQPAKIQMI